MTDDTTDDDDTVTNPVSQNPDPCSAGGKVKFTVNPEGLTLPCQFTVRFEPSGIEVTFTVTGAGDATTGEIAVPAGTTGGSVTSPQTPDFALAVQ